MKHLWIKLVGEFDELLLRHAEGLRFEPVAHLQIIEVTLFQYRASESTLMRSSSRFSNNLILAWRCRNTPMGFFRALEACERRLKLHCVPQVSLRSPSDKIGGLFYFGRMLDKIRLHAKGELPSDYHANLGKGFDEKCVKFLRFNYDGLVERVRQ